MGYAPGPGKWNCTDIISDIISCDGKGHGTHRPLGHAVGKTIGEADERGDGCHIENDTTPGLHMRNANFHKMGKGLLH